LVKLWARVWCLVFLTHGVVLILEPTSGNKLLAAWTGPAKVEKRLENNNYLVTLGRRTLKRHINSLRKYYTDEDETTTSSCETVNVVICESYPIPEAFETKWNAN